MMMADEWQDFRFFFKGELVALNGCFVKYIPRFVTYLNVCLISLLNFDCVFWWFKFKLIRQSKWVCICMNGFPSASSKHSGEPLWDSGSRVAVSGWGRVPAGAPGGQAADGLRCLAVLPEQQQRLLHVPHPDHRPQLWRLLCVPAPAYAGVHGILRTGYVRTETSVFVINVIIPYKWNNRTKNRHAANQLLEQSKITVGPLLSVHTHHKTHFVQFNRNKIHTPESQAACSIFSICLLLHLWKKVIQLPAQQVELTSFT